MKLFSKNKINKAQFGLFLGPVLFLVITFWGGPSEGLSDAGRAILAATCWVAVWWITEPVPIPVTALLPIVLFPLTGGLDIKSTTTAYGSPMIFLFIGGFIIATAIEKWDLHRRIAMNIIYKVGTNSSRIILGLMLAYVALNW